MKPLRRDLTLAEVHDFVRNRHDVQPDFRVQFTELSPPALAALADMRSEYVKHYDAIRAVPNAAAFVDRWGRVRAVPYGTAPEDVLRPGVTKDIRPLPIPTINRTQRGNT